jgi:hypothetical protein
MAPKKKKANSSWPDLAFMLKTDLRAHAHSFYIEASQLMQAVENVGGIPQVIVDGLRSAISLAEKVRDAGEQTPDQIAKELKQIKSILMDHDKRQTSGIQVVQAAMSGRAATSTSQPIPWHAAQSYRDAVLSSHLTGMAMESSWVSGWVRKVPTAVSPVPSNPRSAASSATPVFVPQEELEITIRNTNRAVVDPLRRSPAKLIERANRALRESSDPKISHRTFSAGRVLPSGDILLQTDLLEDVVQLSRKTNWCTAFGDEAKLR